MHPLKMFTKHLQQKENTCYVSKKEKTVYRIQLQLCVLKNCKQSI